MVITLSARHSLQVHEALAVMRAEHLQVLKAFFVRKLPKGWGFTMINWQHNPPFSIIMKNSHF